MTKRNQKWKYEQFERILENDKIKKKESNEWNIKKDGEEERKILNRKNEKNKFRREK